MKTKIPCSILQDCPWCHSKPMIIQDPIRGYKGNFDYYVACINPNCKVNPHTQYYNDIYESATKSIENAINDWNNR